MYSNIQIYIQFFEFKAVYAMCTDKSSYESCYFKLTSVCNYAFPNDLDANGTPFGNKSITKVQTQANV